jgi:hypothetical protein
MPAGGAEITTFLSYTLEKKPTKHPEQFGHGAIEGVARPEAANYASAAGTLVPMLAWGLPTNATAAVMLAAFQSIQPPRACSRPDPRTLPTAAGWRPPRPDRVGIGSYRSSDVNGTPTVFADASLALDAAGSQGLPFRQVPTAHDFHGVGRRRAVPMFDGTCRASRAAHLDPHPV